MGVHLNHFIWLFVGISIQVSECTIIFYNTLDWYSAHPLSYFYSRNHVSRWKNKPFLESPAHSGRLCNYFCGTSSKSFNLIFKCYCKLLLFSTRLIWRSVANVLCYFRFWNASSQGWNRNYNNNISQPHIFM